MTPDAPRHADDITAGWVGAAMASSLTGVRVGSVAVEQITEDVGLVGQVYRIGVGYDTAPDDAPASLILKIPTSDEMIFGFADGMGMYARECGFYEHVAPHVDLVVPEVFHNVCVPSEGSYCILMEEISVGATYRQRDGAPPDRAREVVEAIARFHARWYDHPDLASWDWMPTPGSPQNKSISPRFTGAWPLFQDQFAAVVPARTVDWVEAFAPKMDAFADAHDAGPHTVVHGDFRLDNMLWDTSGEFVLLDWQVIQAGTGMYDIAYFLATNLDTETRRGMEIELLESWRVVQAEAGVDVGGPEDVWRLYQESVLYWITAVTCAVAEFGGSDEGRAVLEMLISRAFTTADDISAGDVMP